jgi:hypothetical protein
VPDAPGTDGGCAEFYGAPAPNGSRLRITDLETLTLVACTCPMTWQGIRRAYEERGCCCDGHCEHQYHPPITGLNASDWSQLTYLYSLPTVLHHTAIEHAEPYFASTR